MASAQDHASSPYLPDFFDRVSMEAFSGYVWETLRGAVGHYSNLTNLLIELVVSSESETITDEEAAELQGYLKNLRQNALLLGSTLAQVAREVDQVHRFDQLPDPKNNPLIIRPLISMLTDSLLLIAAAKTAEELKQLPLASPEELKSLMAGNPGVKEWIHARKAQRKTPESASPSPEETGSES